MQNLGGTLAVDGVDVRLAVFGFLNPLFAAWIHVASELTFVLNSAQLLPGTQGRKGSGGTASAVWAGVVPWNCGARDSSLYSLQSQWQFLSSCCLAEHWINWTSAFEKATRCSQQLIQEKWKIMRAILLTAFAALSTLFGGWLGIRAHKHIHLLLGFGAGVLLGATFFDLLPEAIEAAGQRGWSSREILALTVAGFLIFYLGQRFLALQTCPSGNCEANRRVGRMSAIGLIAHSTMDGASIAAATLISWRIGLVVAVGIIVHDITDGLNTILLVTRGASASKKDLAFLVADAVAPIVGGTLVVFSALPSHHLALILGVTSGFFLFTATGDLLPDAHRRSPGFGVSAATVAGILLIGIAVRLVSV
jgi:zinc transporter ZupT